MGAAAWGVSLAEYASKEGSQRLLHLLSLAPESMDLDRSVLRAWLDLQPAQQGEQALLDLFQHLGPRHLPWCDVLLRMEGQQLMVRCRLRAAVRATAS